MRPLIQLTAAEADRFIIRCRRALAQQARELRISPEPEPLRSAMDTTLWLLGELAAVQPSKRAKIGALIARYANETVAG